MEPPWRRYAGIVVDVLFDHLLAQQWAQFHHQPLAEACAHFYRALARHRALLPEQARRFSDLAPAQRWLERYDDPGHMDEILERIGRRLRRPLSLAPLWTALRSRPEETVTAAFRDTMAALADACRAEPPA